MKRSIRALCLILAALLTAGVPALAEAAEALSFSTDYQGIDDAAQSVLMLYWEDEYYEYSGSAFVAFEEDMLLTNYHVIEGARDRIYAYSDSGEEYVIDRVFAGDRDKDLALVGFSGPTGIPPLNLGDTQGLLRAEPVVAIGSPQGRKNTVSLGNVSGMFEEEGVRYVQFTAPISQGSSGGALFDDRGNVIGITSAYIIDSQNLNLAVDISEATDLYARIEDRDGMTFREFWRAERRANEERVEQSLSDFAGRGFQAESVALFWCERGKNVNFLSTEKTGFTGADLAEFQRALPLRDYYATLVFSMDAADGDTRVEVELELTRPDGSAYTVTEPMHFIAAERRSARVSTRVTELFAHINAGGVYTLRYRVNGEEIASSAFAISAGPGDATLAPATPTPTAAGLPTPVPTWSPEVTAAPSERPAAEDGSRTALRRGDEGEDVYRLQQALIGLDYLDIEADGVYDRQTESAVRSFQRVNGLRGVFYGRADEKTLELLYSGDALPYADPDVVLAIEDGADLDWYGSGSDSEMQFSLVNSGRKKTVTAYKVCYRITDSRGEVELENTVTLQQTIAPGERAVSPLVPVSETEDSYDIEIAILSVTYADGTTVEITRPRYVGWWM